MKIYTYIVLASLALVSDCRAMKRQREDDSGETKRIKQSEQNLLIKAIEESNYAQVLQLLAANEDVNVQDAYGNTPLLAAANAIKGKPYEEVDGISIKIALKLIEAGALWDQRFLSLKGLTWDGLERSVIARIFIAAGYQGSTKAIKSFIKSGIVTLLMGSQDWEIAASALMHAIANEHRALAMELINSKVPQELQEVACQWFTESLAYAAEKDAIEIIELLIKKGADIESVRGNALERAARAGSIRAVKMLLSYEVVPEENGALLSALLAGRQDVVRLLTNTPGTDVNKGDGEWMPLELAIHVGDPEIVKLLVQKGAWIAEEDRQLNAFFIAALKGAADDVLQKLKDKNFVETAEDKQSLCNAALMLVALMGHSELVTALIQEGANVNSADPNEITVLEYALSGNCQEIIDKIIGAGAQVTVAALVRAIQHNHTQTACKLIELGACKNAECRATKNVFSLALEKGNFAIIIKLLEEEVPLDQQLSLNNCWRPQSRIHELIHMLHSASQPEFKRYLAARRAKEYQEYNQVKSKMLAQTPLMWACMLGHTESVDHYLQQQELHNQVDLQDMLGRTALMYTITCEHVSLAKQILTNACQLALDVNKRDIFNNTALYYAVRLGDCTVINALLDAGAQVTSKVIKLAAQLYNKEILINLLFAGCKTYKVLFGEQYPDDKLPRLFN